MSDAPEHPNVISLPSAPAPQDEDSKNLSHYALRDEFVARAENEIKYVDKWGQWYIWDGSRWKKDESLFVQWSVGRFLNGVAKRIHKSRYANAVAQIGDSMPKSTRTALLKRAKSDARTGLTTFGNISTIMAVKNLAKDHRAVATVTEDWDKDPWILNTPAGTVDLRTGAIRPSCKEDLVTKSTSVSPAPGAPYLWLKFLRRIMADDTDVIDYLQKVFGYFLVGDPKQHEMYFGYGDGRNGKGRVIHALMGIMKDYAAVAPIETFTVSKNDRHPTELASLRGARLVTCGETNKHQQWSEAKIKELTGGDPVKARFMRQDEFTYTPQFKLFLTGNNKPHLSHVDAAIEARFRLIPFAVFIPPEERDTNLDAKLETEWPRILNWMIEGCMKWQADGHLDAPARIMSATKGYLEKEDHPRSWYDECCDLNPDIFTTTDALFQSWKDWCASTGQVPGTKTSFSDMLETRQPVMQTTRIRRSKGWGFLGIDLLKRPKKDDET